MKNDELYCPNCKYLYDEDVIEANIGKKFNCENCNIVIYSRINKNMNILLRSIAHIGKTTIKKEKDAEKFLDKIIKICIWEEKKSYSSELLNEFFTRNNGGWVKKSRARMAQRCASASINPPSIKRYFIRNGGNMDIRVIRYYMRGKAYQYPTIKK